MPSQALEAYRVSRWDEAASTWTEIEAMGELRDGFSPVSSARRLGIWPLVALAGLLIGVFALGFVLTFFIPGATDTPNAGPHHDVGRSLGLALVGTVVVGGFTVLQSRRRP